MKINTVNKYGLAWLAAQSSFYQPPYTEASGDTPARKLAVGSLTAQGGDRGRIRTARGRAAFFLKSGFATSSCKWVTYTVNNVM
jgi:hypothetical protein